jgi:hypothetical protein
MRRSLQSLLKKGQGNADSSVVCFPQAIRVGYRQAGDRHCLASQGLPIVLDVEDPTWTSGRPKVSQEVRDLIRAMSGENPLWGAPRIHGEPLKLGIEIGETSRLISSRCPRFDFRSFTSSWS